MTLNPNAPKILLITDDAAEESHTSHILAKYNFTNFLVSIRRLDDALKYFSACNSRAAESAESLPELIILGLRESGRLSLGLVMQSRVGVLGGIPLIVVAESREEEQEIRRVSPLLTASISRPIGFFKLLEAMQKLGMRWVVLKPLG